MKKTPELILICDPSVPHGPEPQRAKAQRSMNFVCKCYFPSGKVRNEWEYLWLVPGVKCQVDMSLNLSWDIT